MMKQTTDFLKMKQNEEKISMITAYDYPTAKLVEQAEVDMILVGDSLGMVVLGYESTVAVTLEDMIHHAKAVKRGAPNTFTVVDMPFMSYHISKEETMHNARRLIQETGAQAVKVEGSGEVIDVIRYLTNAGIPVVAHLGLTPQMVGVLGGYKVQGKTTEAAQQLVEDAKACQEAGAMALVLECIPRQVGKIVQETLSIPTIGIGAGVDCDGQVLVFHDLVRFGVDRLPKFVQAYADINESISAGVKQYVSEVKERKFPSEKHTFTMKEEALTGLYGGIQK